MHTQTSKLILSPLAEAVFQLILIISESDINKTAIPDLSQLAKVVDSQIVNLVAIGTRIQNQPTADDKLCLEMPKACDEVSRASMRLVTGTAELSANPMSKNGKTELLESAKGILSGTTNVLYAFDNFEIRKIIACARLCALKSYTIKMETASLQPQQIVQLLMQTSQIVVQLAQLTTKRTSELLSPLLQQRLKIVVDDLTRESPLLITSSKALMLSAGNPHIRESRNQSCDRILDVCMEIEIVVQMIVDDENASAFGSIMKSDAQFQSLLMQNRLAGQKILALIRLGNVEDATAAFAEYIAGSVELRKRTQEVIEKSKDIKLKQALANLSIRQAEEEARTLSLSKSLFKNPGNTDEQHNLSKSLQATENLWAQVAEKKNQSENSFASLLAKSDENAKKIIRAFTTKDIPAAKSGIEVHDSANKTLKQKALEFMEKNKELAVRNAIQQELIALDINEAKASNVEKELIADPGNKAKIEELGTIFASNTGKWNAINAANEQSTNTVYANLRIQAKDFGNDMVQAVTQKDAHTTKTAYSNLLPILDKLTAHARKMASVSESNEDEARILQILDAQKTLETKIGASTNSLLNDLTNDKRLKELAFDLDCHDTNLGTIARIHQGIKDPIFDALQPQSQVHGGAMIAALHTKDSGKANEAFLKYQADNSKLRARAIEYWEKATDAHVKQNLADLMKQYDNEQARIKDASIKLIADPSDKEGIHQLEKILLKSDNHCSKIAENNQCSEKCIAALMHETQDKAVKLMEAIQKQDLAAINQYFEAFKQGAGNFKQNAQSMLQMITDPKQKSDIQSSIDKLEEFEQEIIRFIDEHQILKEPITDEKIISRISRLIDASNMARNKILSDINKALVCEVSLSINELIDHTRPETILGDLFASAAAGEKTNTPKAIKDFKQASKKLSAIVNLTAIIARDNNDTQLANKLATSHQRLEKLEPSVITALEALNHSPKDAGSIELAKGMTKLWEDGVKDVSNNLLSQEGAFMASEIVAGTKNAFDRHVQLLDLAIKEKDLNAAQKHAKNIAAAANVFLAVAAKEIENSTDEVYKSELLKKVDEVKSILPLVAARIAAFNAFWHANQTWPEFESGDLLSTILNLANGMADLGKIIRHCHGSQEHVIPTVEVYAPEPDVVVEVAIVEPEVVVELNEGLEVVEEEAPKLLSEAEALAAPLKAIAQELKVEASRWSETDNPIIASVKEISNCFARLSQYHQELKLKTTPEAKKGFINAAKDIVLNTAAMVTPAKQIADGCSDLRLKRQLAGTLERITMLSQQLKIVPAVKAASPSDTDKDLQLIACAQNLMNAIKACVKECDTVTLKRKATPILITIDSKSGVPQKAVSSKLVFKRKVYRSVGAMKN